MGISNRRWSIPGRGPGLPALDGLRAVAIAPVLLVHLELLPGGFLGVTIFFTLSGFLIASILIAEFDRTGQMRLARFYVRRLARLYPALLVALALSTSVALLTGHNWHWIRNAIGLSGTYSINLWTAVRGDFFEIVGHMWSLAQEEQFYLVAPVLLLLCLRLGLRRSAAAAVCVIAAAALLAGRTALMATHPEQLARIYENPFLNADGMLIGVALALVLSESGRAERTMHRLPAPPVVTVAVAVMVAAFAGAALRDWRQGVGAALVTLATAVLILHVAAGKRDWLTSVLRSPLARWVGRRSYGIYLYHYPLLAAARWVTRGTGSTLVVELAAVVVAIVLAEVSLRWIEAPVLRTTRRLLDRSPASAASSSSLATAVVLTTPARPAAPLPGDRVRVAVAD